MSNVVISKKTLKNYPENKLLNCRTGVYTAVLLALCFLLPALIMIWSFSTYGMAPYGESSVMIMDMSGQYVEFYNGLKHIDGIGDLFLSWGKNMGGNYIGVFAYYVSSPLSILTLLCPNEYMPIGLLYLTALKVGLCGLTFGLFCRHISKREGKKCSVALPFFAICYGLMSYNIVYSMCLMWIDGVIWLPIVLIGVEKLLYERSAKLLTVSLCAVFISNYYISYMVGMFAVIYFFYRIIADNAKLGTDSKDIGRSAIIDRVARFTISTVTAAALGAWLLLPTLYSLMQGKIGGNGVTASSEWNFESAELMQKLFLGTYDSITNSGTPFLYCGIGILVLATGFFALRRYSIREKLGAAAIVLFMLLSMKSANVDLAWHIFQYPNWFPYRYSFVLSFFFVYLAYRCFIYIEELDVSHYVGVTLIMFFMSGVAYHMSWGAVYRDRISLTAALSACYIVFLIIYARSKRSYMGLTSYSGSGTIAEGAQRERGTGVRISCRVVCCAMVAALMISTVAYEMHEHEGYLLEGLHRSHNYESFDKYYEFQTMMYDALDVVEQDALNNGESDYAAIGQNFLRTYNDAIGFGYRGISHYSSAYNREVNQFYGNLGFAQYYLWNAGFGSTSVTDSLFGVRYTLNNKTIKEWDNEGKIEHTSSIPYDQYELIGTVSGAGDTEIYRNPYAITSPFVGTSEMLNYKWQSNFFESQNELLSVLCGREIRCFERVLDESISEEQEDGTHTIRIVVAKSGVLYGYFNRNSNSQCDMSVNDSSPVTLFRNETNCVQPLGMYEAGDEVVITVSTGKNKLKTDDNFYYILDMEQLKDATDELKQSAMTIDKMGDSSLEGSVTSKGGVLFTAIPYDEGWSVLIDGKEAETIMIANAMLGVEIPEGTHTVEMKYTAKGTYLGAIISVATAGVIIGCWMARRKLTRSDDLRYNRASRRNSF